MRESWLPLGGRGVVTRPAQSLRLLFAEPREHTLLVQRAREDGIELLRQSAQIGLAVSHDCAAMHTMSPCRVIRLRPVVCHFIDWQCLACCCNTIEPLSKGWHHYSVIVPETASAKVKSSEFRRAIQNEKSHGLRQSLMLGPEVPPPAPYHGTSMPVFNAMTLVEHRTSTKSGALTPGRVRPKRSRGRGCC